MSSSPLFLPVSLALLALVALCAAGAWLLVRARRNVRRRAAAEEDARLARASLADVFTHMPHGDSGAAAVLDDNVDAWVARWRMVGSARSTIDVVTFILASDVFGLAFMGMLLRKQREGVQVRLLVDALGSIQSAKDKKWRALLEPLVCAGADVRIYNEITPFKVARVLPALLRRRSMLPAMACDHDKVIVVDDRVALAGGRNVAHEYFGHPDDDARVFFDKDVLLDAPAAVRGLRGAFERELDADAAQSLVCESPTSGRDAPWDAIVLERAAFAMDKWLRASPLDEHDVATLHTSESARNEVADAVLREMRAGVLVPTDDELDTRLRALADDVVAQSRLRGALVRPGPPPFRADMRVVDSCSGVQHGAGPREHKLNQALLALLAAAKHHVLIQTPYVVLPERALWALEDAARRGVRITILTNSPMSSDNPLSQAVFLRHWPRLLARIPNLRIFAVSVERNEHTKAAVFDDEIALVSTYNLDVVSAAINSELAVVMHGADAARAVSASMRARIAAGAPDVREYRIKRNASGLVDGAVQVEFGPEQHVPPALLARTKRLVPIAALMTALPDFADP
jgi:putative cardiolipin synthase